MVSVPQFCGRPVDRGEFSGLPFVNDRLWPDAALADPASVNCRA